MRIQSEGDALIAPRENADDLRRFGVERPHRHIHRRIVIGDARLGAHGRRFAFRRIALHELADDRRGLPDLFVELCRRS